MIPAELGKRASNLYPRADICPATQPVSCAAINSKLPNDFCCGSGTYCLSTDAGSSALCCPAGQNCTSLGTINCDVSLQDASKNTGPIFTTRLSDSLPTCGDNCCPFGYACGSQNSQHMCVLEEFNTSSASQTATFSSVSSTTSPTATGNVDLKNSSNSISTGVLAAIGISGAIGGVLVILAILFFLRRCRSKVSKSEAEIREDMGPKGASILGVDDKNELPAESVGSWKQKHELDGNIRYSIGIPRKDKEYRAFRTRDSQTQPAELA